MFKKMTLAIGLSLVAGGAVAATSGTNDINIGADSQLPVAAQFDMLDQNSDGVISRAEAQASTELSALYDTFDTSATLEQGARQPGHPSGITQAQFAAGLQAMGAGVIGPAVSGGETYIILGDGTRINKDNWDEYRRTHGQLPPRPAPQMAP